ncbi:MAG: chemotaxis protein CheR, partial [Lachnospiraceae bacterium]|nr:chemotaxis protein CheR [Lachnospiraceae bacterium]
MTYDYEYFKKAVYDLTSIDLNAYKEKQMKRRIDTLINKNGLREYDKYVQLIKTDKARFEEFVNYLTINVSEFYRNADQWRLLDKEIIPELIGRFGKNLKIWSAACSTGDEPYSLVMALSQHLPLNQIHILATDLDKQVIAKAKVGLYSEKSVAAVPDDVKRKSFTKIGPSYQVSQEIKD